MVKMKNSSAKICVLLLIFIVMRIFPLRIIIVILVAPAKLNALLLAYMRHHLTEFPYSSGSKDACCLNRTGMNVIKLNI